MSINRYNYEEFFLLYIDNELSATERGEVEEFARQNPDLGHELQMMVQSVLNPDKDVVFPGKESLLQPGWGKHSIHDGNYQEFFVLYGDDELNTSEKAAVEQFVYHHPRFQEEFELMLEVRLTPDHTVVFPDKKTLYRHEKTAKPVIFGWWKITAAAMVLLIAGFTWFNNQDRVKPSRNHTNQTVKTGPGQQVDPSEIHPGKKDNDLTGHPATVGERNVAQAVKAIPSESRVQDLANKQASQKNNMPGQVPNSIQTRPVARELNQNIAERIAQIEHRITPGPADRLASNNIDESLSNPHKAIVDEAVTSEGSYTNSDAKDAMFASNENDETVILANIPVDKKNSLRGLFRRASRFIDKNTALRSGQKSGILIGNIEIVFQ